MKKVLALVLALVMALSLTSVFAEAAEVVAIALCALPLNISKGSDCIAVDSAAGNLVAHCLTICVEHRECKALRVVLCRQHKAESSATLDVYTSGTTIYSHLLRGIRVQRETSSLC